MDQILRDQIQAFIKQGLQEDVRDGDHTSLACIPAQNKDKVKLLVKEDCVLAGVELAQHILRYVDPEVEIELLKKDGDEVVYGDIAFHATSYAQALLKAERLLLNAMQRMSGVATMSRQFQKAIEGLPVTILDTRKTTPLIRFLEKWAVRIGGCTNYRDGLYDWIMIKDNHVDANGSITNAVKKVEEYFDKNKMKLGVTVEVRNFAEMRETMAVGKNIVTRIMLDNFEIPKMAEAVKIINGEYEVEASGGITLKTVRDIAETGVNYISSGALTHSPTSKDLSLKIVKD
jgi:nicotinate-nucleotide pyrophosphorylase (carboxylating)